MCVVTTEQVEAMHAEGRLFVLNALLRDPKRTREVLEELGWVGGELERPVDAVSQTGYKG